MKKFLACILCALTLLSCVVLPGAALDSDEVMLTDCDSRGSFTSPTGTAVAKGTGWTGLGISFDTKEKTQGAASISAGFSGFRAGAPSGTALLYLYNTDTPVDISGKNALAFDVYIGNVEGVRNVNFEIELRSLGWKGSNGDIVERNIITPLSAYALGELSEGWNHIEIPLKYFSTSASFDPTQCCYFRFFNKVGDIGTDKKTTMIKLDNVRFITVEETDGPRSPSTCAYFADGAIYQQNKPMTIWGKAPKGTEIEAILYTADGEKLGGATAMTGADYQWQLTLPAQPGGYDTYKVEIIANGSLLTTKKDIMFGEVWLASGQSNMAFVLQDTYEYDDILQESGDEYLRIFNQPGNPNFYDTLQSEIDGTWVRCDKSTSLAFVPAVAYSFGRTLRAELEVPLGIITAARGSTAIEAWLPKDAVDSDSELKQALTKLGVYKETPTALTDMSAMYNGKVHPMTHLSIAGVVWYQGESNRPRGDLYERELVLLQNSWGKAFGFAEGKMPLIYTQVAPYAQSSTKDSTFSELAPLKQSMLNFYQTHSDSTAMVTIYDLSLRYQDTVILAQSSVIHPTTKRPVGERMGRAALGLCYGGDEFTAPTVKNVSWEGGVATVTFDHVGSGLAAMNDGKGVLGFALGNENGIWVNACAEIVDSCTVKVYNAYMADACYVSYAWDDMNNVASLMSMDGMPAAPFCTGGKNSFGTRPYLDCEGDVFVIADMQATDEGHGSAAYTNLWTLLERATASYDHEYYAQGAGSIMIDYKAGQNEVMAGIDLTDALTFSVTEPFKGMKTVSLRIANGDAADKQIRLCIVTSKGNLYTAPVTLKSNADFDTLVFDLTGVYQADGTLVNNTNGRALNTATGFAVCIDDSNDGSVWVDAILLGTDTCTASMGEDTTDTPAEQPADPADGLDSETIITILVIVIIILVLVLIALSVVLVIVLKKKK